MSLNVSFPSRAHAFFSRLLTLGFVLAVLLALTSCSQQRYVNSSGTSSASATTGIGSKWSDDAAIKAILRDGTVTYSEYQHAMNTFFRCVTEEGFKVKISPSTMTRGVRQINYQIEVPNKIIGDPVNACYQHNAAHVDEWWQVDSAGAIAFRKKQEAQLLPVLVKCLQKNGRTIPQKTSYDKVMQIAATSGHVGDVCLRNTAQAAK